MEAEINPALNLELDRAQEEIEVARTLIAHGKPDHSDAAIGRLDVAIRFLQGVRGSLVFDQERPTYPAGTVVGAISGKHLLAQGWTPADPPARPVDDPDDERHRAAPPPVDTAADVPPVPPQFRPGPEQMLRLTLRGALG